MPVNADEKGPNRADDGKPIVLKTQGSFTAGGTVLTNPGEFDPIALTPDGQTIHGDHAYVQYQIPVGARKYPIVMWHGGGLDAMTVDQFRFHALELHSESTLSRAATVGGEIIIGIASTAQTGGQFKQLGEGAKKVRVL